MDVEVDPKLYRHGKVSMQFKARGGFSVRVSGVEVAGSRDVASYDETLSDLINDVTIDDNTRESLKQILEATSRSLYSEYVIVESVAQA